MDQHSVLTSGTVQVSRARRGRADSSAACWICFPAAVLERPEARRQQAGRDAGDDLQDLGLDLSDALDLVPQVGGPPIVSARRRSTFASFSSVAVRRSLSSIVDSLRVVSCVSCLARRQPRPSALSHPLSHECADHHGAAYQIAKDSTFPP